MIDGFYSIAFAGLAGTGFGIIVLRDGKMVGADAAGAEYDGEYRQQGGHGPIEVTATLSARAGIALVQTGVPSLEAVILQFAATLPEDFAAGQPVLIQMPMGPVNVIFKKIRDFPS